MSSSPYLSVSESLFDHSMYTATNSNIARGKERGKKFQTINPNVVGFNKKQEFVSIIKKNETTPTVLPTNNKTQLTLPEYVRTFESEILSFGLMNLTADVYHRIRSIYPLVSANQIQSETDNSKASRSLALTNNEVKLANLYKCDIYHHGCYFTTEQSNNFQKHLDEQHPNQSLYCFYCTKPSHHLTECSDGSVNSHISYNSSENLINHITNEHGKTLKYQCNFCYYRALSVDHVFLHQALEHTKNFEEAIKFSTVLVEEKVLQPTEGWVESNDASDTDEDDDDTEIEDNNEDHGFINRGEKRLKKSIPAKIIDCQLETSNLNESVEMAGFLNRFGHKLEAFILKQETNQLACLWCPLGFSVVDECWKHSITEHWSCPMMAYDLDLLRNKFVENRPITRKSADSMSESSVTDMISAFRQALSQNSLPRTFNEKLMAGIFGDETNDEKDDDGSQKKNRQKGNKRKLVDLEQQNQEEGVESSTNDIENNPTKRKRFNVNWFKFPKSIWSRGRALTGTAITAVTAFTFYHLTNLVPAFLNKNLNQIDPVIQDQPN